MTKSIWLLGLLVLLLGFPISAQDDCVPASGAPLRLGAIFPPETLFSTASAESYWGAATMVEAVNACGGVNGQPVELVYVPAGNEDETVAAVAQLADVPLIIGSGSAAISAVQTEQSQNGDFIFWEVSEALDDYHPWSFSPRLNHYDLGLAAARYAQNTLAAAVLAGEPLNAALIYESRPAAQFAADAITTELGDRLLLTLEYEAPLYSAYDLAVDIRELDINVVFVVGFEDDADQLWYDTREADANVKAWIHVGGQDFRWNTCERLGNTDTLISIGATGHVQRGYRRQTIGAIYEHYLSSYQSQFEQKPGEPANQAASGTYLLLRHLLPEAAAYTPAAIQQAIVAANLTAPAGLMGEGLAFPFGEGTNSQANAIVMQRQNGKFCTLWPETVATCDQSVQPFITWRERAKLAEETICEDEPIIPPDVDLVSIR